MDQNRLNGQKWTELTKVDVMDWIGPKWTKWIKVDQMDQIEPNWTKTDQNGLKLTK